MFGAAIADQSDLHSVSCPLGKIRDDCIQTLSTAKVARIKEYRWIVLRWFSFLACFNENLVHSVGEIREFLPVFGLKVGSESTRDQVHMDSRSKSVTLHLADERQNKPPEDHSFRFISLHDIADRLHENVADIDVQRRLGSACYGRTEKCCEQFGRGGVHQVIGMAFA